LCSAGVRVDCAPVRIANGELCTFRLKAGALPRGLSLSTADGRIAGVMVSIDDPVPPPPYCCPYPSPYRTHPLCS